MIHNRSNAVPLALILALSISALILSACQPQAVATAGPSAVPPKATSPEATSTAAIPAVDLDTVLSALSGSPGWSVAGDARFYDRDNLYDLMNGQSDSYFVYGFERAGMQRFTHESATGVEVLVTVFQVSAPPGAYGLASANGSGDDLDVGNGGHVRPGERLCFWQSRYYVQVTALQPIPPDTLLSAARTISAALPTGGDVPAIVTRLPEQGENVRFFHEELSIQDYIWLGGENILGLGQDTHGALARYILPGGDGWLVVIAYPNAQRAQAGYLAIQSADLADLAAFAQRENHLAAVFGPLDSGAAEALVQSALDPYAE